MPAGPNSPTRTIALMNQKGGVGKTTTAVSLAHGLARLRKRVLLIDLDPQAHASLHLGIEAGARTGKPSAYDLLLDPAIGLAAAVVNARENLDVLPAETDLAAIETELAGQPDRLFRLSAALDAAPGRYDFVLIDCPPSLGVLTLNGLAAVREIFVPMQAHFLAMQGMVKLMDTVRLIARQTGKPLHVTGVVLCQHETTTSHGREVVAELDRFFESARGQALPWSNGRVYRPAIRRNVKLTESPSFGQTVFEYAPGCPGALDYAALAEKLASEWDELTSRRPATTVVTPAPAAKV